MKLRHIVYLKIQFFRMLTKIILTLQIELYALINDLWFEANVSIE